jgi:hypothetical protein
MTSSIKKYLFLVFATLISLLTILFFNYSTNKIDVSKSINELGLIINPKFKENINYYYVTNCDESKYNELQEKNINSKIDFNYPYINISNMDNLIKKQKYTFTCVPKTIPKFGIVNSKPASDYFMFTDSLLLDNNLSQTYDSSAVLRDSQGTPIWWISTKSPALKSENYNFVSDPKLINNNTQVLFYASKDILRGYSDGEYLIYDLKLNKIIKKYYGTLDENGKGSLDQHDLIIRPDGTAVGLRYPVKTDIDLTKIGIKKGTPIVDGEIVLLNADGSQNKAISMLELIDPKEIDLGILKFYGVNTPPYDLIHLNSVELDGDSVIVSSRNIDAVHKINLKTGKIVWRLGGFSNTKYDLKLKSAFALHKQREGIDRYTVMFSSQHDARKVSNNILSIFGNGTYANRNPKVLEFKIEEAKLEAEIIRIYASTFQDRSNCCGSARKLNNGEWLVNWGGDFRFNGKIPSVISTINEANLESNILLNPLGVINYRAVPYQLTNDQLNLFKQDLISRKVDIR